MLIALWLAGKNAIPGRVLFESMADNYSEALLQCPGLFKCNRKPMAAYRKACGWEIRAYPVDADPYHRWAEKSRLQGFVAPDLVGVCANRIGTGDSSACVVGAVRGFLAVVDGWNGLMPAG